MKNLLFAAAGLLLLATACKKDDDGPECPVTAEGLAGTYKIGSFTANGIDVRGEYFEDCQLDDLITLNANGTYTYVDAGTECDPNGDETGSWSITGNTLSIDILPLDLNVQSFDCTTLRGTAIVSGFNVEGTLIKQ